MAWRKGIVLPVILAIAGLPALATGAKQKRVRGFVLSLPSPTSFQVEDYTIQQTGKTRLEYPPGHEGALYIGSEVEVAGDYDPQHNVLLAQRIRVHPSPSGRVRGQAILEYPPQVFPDGLLLFCDGRKVRVDGSTELFERKDQNQLISIPDLQQKLGPGSYVDYEGTISPDGSVEADKIVFWKHTTEKAEAKLLAEYQPRLHLPGEAGAPTMLSVGKARYRLYPVPAIQSYVNRVGARLVSTFRDDAEGGPFAHSNFWFFVVDNLQPGATAYPSGVVVVHSGQLYVVANEAQLAFLLGHELAHAVQEHAWRQWCYHRRKLLFLRWATAHLTRVAEEAIRKGYERELENQADRLALAYMARAGYDPREGYSFLKRLEKVWRFGLSPLLWGSHGSFSSRRRAIMAVVNTAHRGLEFNRLEKSEEGFAALRLHLPQARIKTASQVRN